MQCMHIIIQDSGFQLAGIAVSIAPERRFPYAGLAENPGPEYSLFATRTLSHINPVLTDDDAYQVAFGLAAMQKCELSSVHRVDSAVLEAE